MCTIQFQIQLNWDVLGGKQTQLPFWNNVPGPTAEIWALPHICCQKKLETDKQMAPTDWVMILKLTKKY